MGYNDLDNDHAPVADQSPGSHALIFLVRIIGVCLLLAGIALAGMVMMQAWALYKYPDRIETFAQAVERGSNIDKAISPPRLAGTAAGQEENAAPAGPIRLSYFFAWFIVFILVMVLARIALAAVSTGGQLALYDTEVRKLARALLAEKSRAER